MMDQSSDEEFTDTRVRHGFARKVFTMLTFRFIIIITIAIIPTSFETAREFVRINLAAFFIPAASLWFIMCFMGCCDKIGRNKPTNFIMLEIMITIEAYGVSVLAMGTDFRAVLSSYGMIAVICSSLAILTLQTKFDISRYGSFIFVCGFNLLIASLVWLFIKENALRTHFLIACGFAMFYSLYIVIEIVIMVENCHHRSVTPNEYTLAVLCVYLDLAIVSLITVICCIVGTNSSKNVVACDFVPCQHNSRRC